MVRAQARRGQGWRNCVPLSPASRNVEVALRVTLSFVSNELEEYEFEQMLAPITDKDWIQMVTRKIADESGVKTSSVRVWWCGPVSEYCIDINGKWSGYVDLEKYWHNVIGGMRA